MRPYTTRGLAFALTGIGWPALMVIFSLLWPGPVVPTEFTFNGVVGVPPSARPPVDRTGSLMHLVIQYDPNSASAEVYIDGEDKVPVSRIFWEIPGESEVQAEPAEAAPEGTATPSP